MVLIWQPWMRTPPPTIVPPDTQVEQFSPPQEEIEEEEEIQEQEEMEPPNIVEGQEKAAPPPPPPLADDEVSSETTYCVQLFASFRLEPLKTFWDTLRQNTPALFEPVTVSMPTVNHNGKTLYRLRVGIFTKATLKDFTQQLEQHNIDYFVLPIPSTS